MKNKILKKILSILHSSPSFLVSGYCFFKENITISRGFKVAAQVFGVLILTIIKVFSYSPDGNTDSSSYPDTLDTNFLSLSTQEAHAFYGGGDAPDGGTSSSGGTASSGCSAANSSSSIGGTGDAGGDGGGGK